MLLLMNLLVPLQTGGNRRTIHHWLAFQRLKPERKNKFIYTRDIYQYIYFFINEKSRSNNNINSNKNKNKNITNNNNINTEQLFKRYEVSFKEPWTTLRFLLFLSVKTKY